MASLIHEPNRPRKPWRVSWTERRRRRTKRFATKREAQAFIGDLVRGQRYAGTDLMTLDAWFEKWLRGHGLAWEPRTRHDRGSYIDRLISPHLGQLRLTEIGRSDVREWRATLVRSGSTPHVANRAVTVLSAALGAAVEDDLIPANPCFRLKKLPEPVNRRLPAPVADIEKIRAALTGRRDRTIVSLLAYAGLRPSEVQSLQWADVRERTLVVRSAARAGGGEKTTKTQTERPIPISLPLHLDLCSLDRDHQLVCGGDNLEWHNFLTRVWRPARERAGVEWVPYNLRHSFATLKIAEGLNPWQVAALMGHSTPDMVIRRYGHLFAEAELAPRIDMEREAMNARHAAVSISRAMAAKRPKG